MAETNSISNYISSRLLRLGIELSGIEIAALGIKYMSESSLNDKLTAQNINEADKIILYPIRDIFLMPKITEGGYSVEYDKESLIKWYNSEVQRLGLTGDPNFSLAPKIRDASNRW